MYSSYQKRQDRYYDNEFLDRYYFVKNSVGKTTELSVTIFNHLIYAIFNLVISVSFIYAFDMSLLVLVSFSSFAMVFVNLYIVRKRMKLEKSSCRMSGRLSTMEACFQAESMQGN